MRRSEFFYRPAVALCASLLLMTAACGGDDDDDDDAAAGGDGTATPTGTAPTATGINVLQTSGNVVGQTATVLGTFLFNDPDGDVTQYAGKITAPSGAAIEIPPQNVPGIQPGMKSGTIQFTLAVQILEAGTYAFEMWVLDAGRNESNHTQGSFDTTAQ